MGTLTNLEDVKRSLAIGSNIDGTIVFDKHLDDAQITEDIQSASDWFSELSGKDYYGADGTLTLDAEDRYVHGRKLFFRTEVHSITRIENDGTGTLTATDWVTMPRNSTPLRGVELKDKYWRWTTSPLGAIKVIGVIGNNPDGQPPDRVHLAVTRLASHLYMTRDNQGQIQVGDREAELPPDTPRVVRDVLALERQKRIGT